MFHISEEQVRETLPMAACIARMRDCFTDLAAGSAGNLPRRRMFLPAGTVFHELAGWWRGFVGIKHYATNAKQGEAHFHFVLYDAATSRPLALFDANALGQIRTGACTGLATAVMSARDAETLALFGSGFQAWTQLQALVCVRQFKSVRVYSRKQENRERFAARAREAFGLDVQAAPDPRAALRDAQVVTTITYSKDPLFSAAWLAPGAHINAAGSNARDRREIPSEAVTGAGAIAVDSREQAAVEAGDLLLAVPAAEWDRLPLQELSSIVADGYWRRPAQGFTLFKSLGLGVEDVAAAALVYEAVR